MSLFFEFFGCFFFLFGGLTVDFESHWVSLDSWSVPSFTGFASNWLGWVLMVPSFSVRSSFYSCFYWWLPSGYRVLLGFPSMMEMVS